jgi:hypothetical protein
VAKGGKHSKQKESDALAFGERLRRKAGRACKMERSEEVIGKEIKQGDQVSMCMGKQANKLEPNVELDSGS